MCFARTPKIGYWGFTWHLGKELDGYVRFGILCRGLQLGSWRV